MRKFGWYFWLAIFLIILSIMLYLLHYAIFVDPHHIFIYMLGDLAFLPIEVLLVTIIIHSLLSQREKRIIMEKLNMVIETFFTEIGADALRFFIRFDSKIDSIRLYLMISPEWTAYDFHKAREYLKSHDYEISFDSEELKELLDILVKKREFILRLLENPNLLQHESFSDLLRALSHLIEELLAREDLSEVTGKDYEHICGDIGRAYGILVNQWLDYMEYLKNNYPYLFSLASRLNPFDPNASAQIR